MKNYKFCLRCMTFIFLSLFLAGLAMPVKSFALPVADAGGPYTVAYGMSVDFDGSGSNTEFPSEIVNWEWDLDLDGVFDVVGEIVTVNTSFWAGPGDYQILLRVTDRTNGIYYNYEYDDDIASLTITEPIPEPTTMILFGTGLAGLAAVGRRRKK